MKGYGVYVVVSPRLASGKRAAVKITDEGMQQIHGVCSVCGGDGEVYTENYDFEECDWCLGTGINNYSEMVWEDWEWD